MEPSEEVRRWISELLGIVPEGDRLSWPLDAWGILEPALDAVHRATVPMETEPATQMVLHGLEGATSEGDRGSPM
jgi:hypothetical protein